MGAEPAYVPLIIGAVAAAAGGAVTYEQARKQNAAIKTSQRLTREAAEFQAKQVGKAASLEQQKNRVRAQQVIGRIRVAQAESGLAEDGSYLSLINQAEYDANLNSKIIDENRKSQIQRTYSGAQADLTQLASRISDPILAAFTGGLGGAQTGLSIGSTIAATPSGGGTQTPAASASAYIDPAYTTGNPGSRYT